MDGETTLVRNGSASFEVVEGEAIVIHLESGSYYSLDEVGTLVWEQLDGQRTLGEIAGHIAQRYEVEAAMVTDDVVELATELRSEGLVDPV